MRIFVPNCNIFSVFNLLGTNVRYVISEKVECPIYRRSLSSCFEYLESLSDLINFENIGTTIIYMKTCKIKLRLAI